MKHQRDTKTNRYRCRNHRNRIAWVERHGELLCHECAYGRAEFERHLGRQFYEPGGPGFAGEVD